MRFLYFVVSQIDLNMIQIDRDTNNKYYIPLLIIHFSKQRDILHHKKNVFLVVSSSGYGVISIMFVNKRTARYLPTPDILIIFRRIAHWMGLGWLHLRFLVLFWHRRFLWRLWQLFGPDTDLQGIRRCPKVLNCWQSSFEPPKFQSEARSYFLQSNFLRRAESIPNSSG